MCRWITYLSSSDPVNLSDLVLKAENSLVKMSFNAGYHPGFGPTNNSLFNGDGFGVGWYYGTDGQFYCPVTNATDKKYYENRQMQPALFRDVLPAWSDSNLQEVCTACRSHCIVAHVRAASPGSVVSRENCHPFKCGRLLFCHNGRIDGFWGPLRKTILNDLTQNAYSRVRGTTDSEAVFGIILSEIELAGYSLAQTTPYPSKVLVNAIRNTIDKLNHYQRTMDSEIQREFCRGFSTLNFSLTDGVTMVISRYCDQHPEIPAPSLYFAFDHADSLKKGITKGAGMTPNGNGMNTQGPGDGSDNHSAMASNATSSEPAEPPTPMKKSEFEALVNESMAKDTKAVDGMRRVTSFQDFGTAFKNDKYKSKSSGGAADYDKFAFCVASDPLTFCDMWTPIPANSIMSYKVGGVPQLIILEDKSSVNQQSGDM